MADQSESGPNSPEQGLAVPPFVMSAPPSPTLEHLLAMKAQIESRYPALLSAWPPAQVQAFVAAQTQIALALQYEMPFSKYPIQPPSFPAGAPVSPPSTPMGVDSTVVFSTPFAPTAYDVSFAAASTLLGPGANAGRSDMHKDLLKAAVASLLEQIKGLDPAQAIQSLAEYIAGQETAMITADRHELPQLHANKEAASSLLATKEKLAASLRSAATFVGPAPAAAANLVPAREFCTSEKVSEILKRVMGNRGTMIQLPSGMKDKFKPFDPRKQAGVFQRGLDDFVTQCSALFSEERDRPLVLNHVFPYWHLLLWTADSVQSNMEHTKWVQEQGESLTWASYCLKLRVHVVDAAYRAEIALLRPKLKYDPKSSRTLQEQCQDFFNLVADCQEWGDAASARSKMITPSHMEEFFNFLGGDDGYSIGKQAYQELLFAAERDAPMPTSLTVASSRSHALTIVDTITVKALEIKALRLKAVYEASLLGQARARAAATKQEVPGKKIQASGSSAPSPSPAPAPTAGPASAKPTAPSTSGVEQAFNENQGPCSHCGLAKGHYISGCHTPNTQGVKLTQAQRQEEHEKYIASRRARRGQPSQHYMAAQPELREQVPVSDRFDVHLWGAVEPTATPGVMFSRQGPAPKTITVEHPRFQESKEEFDKQIQSERAAKRAQLK